MVGEIETGYQCIESGAVDCLQILYNLLYGASERLIEAAGNRGMGVIVRSPLNSGLLSGTYTPKTTFVPNDERSQFFSGREFEDRLNALQKIQQTLHIKNNHLIEFSLQYILSNPCVSITIPGASSMSQAARYINCSEKARLDQFELDRIRRVVAYHMQHVSPIFQN